MKIKKLSYVLLAATTFVLASCNINEYPKFDDADAFVAIQQTSASTAENNPAGKLQIPVMLTSLSGLQGSVDFEITPAEENGAQEGVNFTVEGSSKTLTFTKENPTQYIVLNIIDNDTFGGDVKLTIKLTNLPTLPEDPAYYPQVWYYLNNSKNDSIQYTSANQTIAVNESTRVSVYIIDEDSGKVVKSAAVTAQYTIRQDPALRFYTSENSYMSTGSTENISYDDEFTSPVLKGKINGEYTDQLTALGVTYSSSVALLTAAVTRLWRPSTRRVR